MGLSEETEAVAVLDSQTRARLPDSSFAYVDSRGQRRLPINDAAHVRNALARFEQTSFEDSAARERARQRGIHDVVLETHAGGLLCEGPEIASEVPERPPRPLGMAG